MHQVLGGRDQDLQRLGNRSHQAMLPETVTGGLLAWRSCWLSWRTSSTRAPITCCQRSSRVGSAEPDAPDIATTSNREASRIGLALGSSGAASNSRNIDLELMASNAAS